MPIYAYKGILNTGKEVKSSLTAENLNQAKQRIHSMGIMLIDISEKTSAKEGAQPLNISSKIKIQDLSLMTRQLATLIKARIPISESLSALIDQVDHPTLRIILAEVRQKINEGASLAKALSDYPRVFDNVYVNMVEAGEASGTLSIVLIRLAEFTEGQSKLKNKIMGSMMYPMIMALVGLSMMTFIFVVIIPKITRIFSTMKKELPTPTKICIAISNYLQDYWWTLLVGIPIFVFLLKKYIKTKKGRGQWDKLMLKLPIMGGLVKMINIGRFSSTLATLLSSGVPILTALRIVTNLISNVHIQSVVDSSREAVSEGASMTGPLVSSGHFPPLVTHMIKLGEKSGELESMLEIVADNYESQVNSKLEGLTSILEPIMMIFLGGAVAFIVISVIVPMMEMTSVRS